MRKFFPASLLGILLLAGCGGGPEPAPVLAEAYAGPAALKIRRDIPLQSAVVVTVQHGDKLEIVQRRRRFLKVRAPNGAEGWIEENQLLSREEMARLRQLAGQARTLPSQGIASTYEALNVHTLPERNSPSFAQIKEGEKVDVLTTRVSPRTASTPRPPLIPPPPKRPRPEPRKKENKYAPPAPPPAPKPPVNWLELSRTPAPPAGVEVAEKTPPPVPMDEWSLIRTSKGQSGWVLSRRLYMAIPDEVAQYAEGHRITSYFSLGDVQDGDQVKHHWLWTTIGQSLQAHDFDSFRVFIWSLRRHRYETAYIERNLRGYSPVLTGNVELASSGKRGAPAAATYPGFSVCVEKKDGMRYRRRYAFIVNVVRFAGEQPCEAKARTTEPAAAPLTAAAPSPARPSFYERLRRWFGRGRSTQ